MATAVWVAVTATSGEIWGDMGRYGELRSSRGESDSVMPPWRYTSNRHHPMSEGARMREDLEPLLLAAGTDLVLNGRAHPRRARRAQNEEARAQIDFFY